MPLRRTGMGRATLPCLLLLLFFVGCDDDSPAGEGADASPRQAIDASGGGPRVVADAAAFPDAGETGDAGQAADAGDEADMAPPPECTSDDNCGDGRVCYDDQCVDGTRCEDGECPSGRICVGGLCIADPNSTGGLTAEPDVLVFSFSQVGDQASRGFTLTNEGESTIHVVAFEFSGAPVFTLGSEIELPLRLVPSQQESVLIQHVPNDREADVGTLRIVTDQAGTQPAEIRLVSEHKQVGGADPCIIVSPARLNFGVVARGATGRQSFELVSCGMAPVTINAIRRGNFFGLLPDTFQLENPPQFPLVLEPGARQMITSTYSPRRAGIEAGFWNVLTTDPANPEVRVDVSAIAEPPPLEDVELHIRLTWDTDLTDVDLHLLAPNGQMWTCEGDCYFSNGQPNWGDPNAFVDDPFLDLDDVDGHGPENINLEAPVPGTYRVLVHYWSDHGGDDPRATLEVLNFGQVVAQYGPTQLSNIDDTWEVVDITFPGLQLMPLGGVNQVNRAGLCGGF